MGDQPGSAETVAAAKYPVLRRFGYGRTHAGGPFVPYVIGRLLGSEARLAMVPTIARCGVELRGSVVLMREGVVVDCPTCRRILKRQAATAPGDGALAC